MASSTSKGKPSPAAAPALASTADLFDKQLPEALKRNAAKAQAELNATFLLTVSGVGAWLVRAVPEEEPSCKRAVTDNPHPRPDVTITIRETDFRALMNSPLKAYTAGQLAFTGKMTVDGPMQLAARLEKLLGYLA
jgi:putative sterol carrier protein